MTRSKGYTDELEKLNRDDSGLAVTIGLKEAAAKKLRLRITGYSQAEYWYLFSNKGYIMSYKNLILFLHLLSDFISARSTPQILSLNDE